MIANIANALSKGFNSKQIIEYLIRKFPEHKDKIKNAVTAGFTAEQVVNFLGGGRKSVNKEVSSPTTEHELTRGTDVKRRENVNQGALAAGTLAATSLAAPLAASALQRAIPSNLSPMIPTLTEELLPQTKQQQPQQPPVDQVTPNIAQPAQAMQSEGISDKLWDSIQKGKLTDRDPNVSAFMKVANSLRKTRGLTSKDQFDSLYKSFENKRQMGLEGPELARELFAEWEQMKSPSQEIPENKIKSIEKSQTVATPQGIGEVKEIRNGKAIVEVEGKKHAINEDELEASPIPEKDLADLYDELIKGIEGETGEDVSRMVQWAGYNPENNTLQFLPHTGKLYKYANISPEDAALLTDILSVRKTSGENFIGAWKKDSKSPIGAALSKLIRKLQSERGGKGNEYEETHEPIYSAYEPAIQAKKKKKKK